VVGGGDNDIPRRIDEITKEVRDLKRDLYGNPRIKGQSVFDRLDRLDEELRQLRATYERERIEAGALGAIEDRIDQLTLDYRVLLVYLRGLVGGVGTLVLMALVAAVVGVLRFLAGGG
jgi:septation ring formation regulator EzrA